MTPTAIRTPWLPEAQQHRDTEREQRALFLAAFNERHSLVQLEQDFRTPAINADIQALEESLQRRARKIGAEEETLQRNRGEYDRILLSDRPEAEKLKASISVSLDVLAALCAKQQRDEALIASLIEEKSQVAAQRLARARDNDVCSLINRSLEASQVGLAELWRGLSALRQNYHAVTDLAGAPGLGLSEENRVLLERAEAVMRYFFQRDCIDILARDGDTFFLKALTQAEQEEALKARPVAGFVLGEPWECAHCSEVRNDCRHFELQILCPPCEEELLIAWPSRPPGGLSDFTEFVRRQCQEVSR